MSSLRYYKNCIKREKPFGAGMVSSPESVSYNVILAVAKQLQVCRCWRSVSDQKYVCSPFSTSFGLLMSILATAVAKGVSTGPIGTVIV